MNENQRKVFEACKSQLKNSNNITQIDIQDMIAPACIFVGVNLDYDEKEIVMKELECIFCVKSSSGQLICSEYEENKWYDDIKSEISTEHWDTYRDYLIDDKNFPPNIVSQLGDETLDKYLLNSLGNPNSNQKFLKRGLVIGDVQSGKTSTYIGLMCKSADAGYKVFIMLTGTVESLRKQTQERIEEGFIGLNIEEQKPVGIKGVKESKVDCVTSRKSDFKGDKNQSLFSFTVPTVLVVKKNASNLKKLQKWLIATGATKQPLLMIDDEADNASINTKNDKDNPTAINKSIRQILDSFDKANYVGFTATPYANVFIDPDKDEEMVLQDLFPEDFIYSLPTPSNYIGAESIYLDNSKHANQLRYIQDAGKDEKDGFDLYFKHKKDWDKSLPDSLTEAIYAFYLVNAIRDIKGDKNSHRSMLVNISRFVSVQKHTKNEIEDIHKRAYSAIKFDLEVGQTNFGSNKILNRLYDVYLKEYSEYDWEEITKVIYDSVKNVKIKVINSEKSTSDKLEYKDSSVRVIAIGGLALSRGLTLEGLIISYFFRNTATYDVLMQMGRWFGYRKGFEELFRIWTYEDSAEWYKEIALATKELRNDMEIMSETGKKPSEFGIRVRHDCKELGITARNKMRNASEHIYYENFYGNIFETPYLEANAETQKSNYDSVLELVKECKKYGQEVEIDTSLYGKYKMIHNVKRDTIVDFMKNVNI